MKASTARRLSHEGQLRVRIKRAAERWWHAKTCPACAAGDDNPLSALMKAMERAANASDAELGEISPSHGTIIKHAH